MARRTAKARMTCPVCGKASVSVSIQVAPGNRAVVGRLGVHGGLHLDPKTKKAADCGGSGRRISSADLPPMSEWS